VLPSSDRRGEVPHVVPEPEQDLPELLDLHLAIEHWAGELGPGQDPLLV
jgi:hypothetical protein